MHSVHIGGRAGSRLAGRWASLTHSDITIYAAAHAAGTGSPLRAVESECFRNDDT